MKKVDIPIFLVILVDIPIHGCIFNGSRGNAFADSYFAMNYEIATLIALKYCSNCSIIQYSIHAFALLFYALYHSAFFIKLLIEHHYYLYKLVASER